MSVKADGLFFDGSDETAFAGNFEKSTDHCR